MLLKSLQEKVFEKYNESEKVLNSIAGVQAEIDTVKKRYVPDSAPLGIESESAAAKYELELLKEQVIKLDTTLKNETLLAEEAEARLQRKEQDLKEFAVTIYNELNYLQGHVTALLEDNHPQEMLSMAQEEERMQKYLWLNDAVDEKSPEDIELERDIEGLKSDLQQVKERFDTLNNKLLACTKQKRSVSRSCQKPIIGSGRRLLDKANAMSVSDQFKTVSELIQEHPQYSHPTCNCFPPMPADVEKKPHSNALGESEYWVCPNLKFQGAKRAARNCGFFQVKK